MLLASTVMHMEKSSIVPFFLEANLDKLLPELFRVGLLHPLHTDQARLDHLPGRLSSALGGKRRKHLRWHNSKYGGQCEPILSIFDDVFLLRLDDVP
jgi:hypothetical protein